MLPRGALPRGFPWASPLGALSSGAVDVPGDALPLYVRETPVQALSLEDLVLVGRRERVRSEHMEAERERLRLRDLDFKKVASDKTRAISQLEKKNDALHRAYSRLNSDYGVESAETFVVRAQASEDQALLQQQAQVLKTQEKKTAQLAAMSREAREEVAAKRSSLLTERGQERQLS